MILVAANAKLGDMADPAFTAHADTPVYLAVAVWENWMPIDMLQATVRKAKVELTHAKRQWAVVKGPAAALVATLARIGWTLVDAKQAYTDQQEEVSFLNDSPAMIKRMIHNSARRWRWRAGGLAGSASVNGEWAGPLWKPVADLIANGKWRDTDGGGSAR